MAEMRVRERETGERERERRGRERILVVQRKNQEERSAALCFSTHLINCPQGRAEAAVVPRRNGDYIGDCGPSGKSGWRAASLTHFEADC